MENIAINNLLFDVKPGGTQTAGDSQDISTQDGLFVDTAQGYDTTKIEPSEFDETLEKVNKTDKQDNTIPEESSDNINVEPVEQETPVKNTEELQSERPAEEVSQQDDEAVENPKDKIDELLQLLNTGGEINPETAANTTEQVSAETQQQTDVLVETKTVEADTKGEVEQVLLQNGQGSAAPQIDQASEEALIGGQVAGEKILESEGSTKQTNEVNEPNEDVQENIATAQQKVDEFGFANKQSDEGVNQQGDEKPQDEKSDSDMFADDSVAGSDVFSDMGKSQNEGAVKSEQLHDEPSVEAAVSVDQQAGTAEQKADATVLEQIKPEQGIDEMSPGQRVNEQITSSINNAVKDGQNEITVALNPPELGKVHIQLQEQNGELTGTLRFSKAETKLEIEQLMPQLIKDLQASGVTVKKIAVVQTDVQSGDYQQFKEHVAQQGNDDYQEQSNSWSGERNYVSQRQSPDSIYSGSDSVYESSYINDDAMNILI